MAKITPEELADGGGSSAGDEERAMAREVRRMSDQELRDKAQRLQAVWFEGPVPPACWLPDRGEKLRLLLQGILDEINRRRRVTAAATPGKLPGGESRVGDDEAGTAAREVPDRVRQMSDRELRQVAQRWKPRNSLPAGACLPDGGEKMRHLLRAVLDEISNRRRQHGSNGATRRVPDVDGRRSELHVAQQRHGPVNEATTTALPERRQSSGEVNAGGGKRVREAPRQSSDSEQALWERAQRLQELFAGPDGCKRLRLFLETCFREVNSNRERRHAHACASKKAPVVVVENASSGGAKRRRGFANEAAATSSPEEEPGSGSEEATRERAEAEVRQLSDQALWERAQRCRQHLRPRAQRRRAEAVLGPRSLPRGAQ